MAEYIAPDEAQMRGWGSQVWALRWMNDHPEDAAALFILVLIVYMIPPLRWLMEKWVHAR